MGTRRRRSSAPACSGMRTSGTTASSCRSAPAFPVLPWSDGTGRLRHRRVYQAPQAREYDRTGVTIQQVAEAEDAFDTCLRRSRPVAVAIRFSLRPGPSLGSKSSRTSTSPPPSSSTPLTRLSSLRAHACMEEEEQNARISSTFFSQSIKNGFFGWFFEMRLEKENKYANCPG